MHPKRFLVVAWQDWMAPRAGGAEHYLHQVFSRIAARGHYVAWLCAGPRPISWLWSHDKLLKKADGIQIAFLGDRFFFPLMVRLFLSRMAKQGTLRKDFDVIINSVDGRALRIPEYEDIPVVPLVFDAQPLGRAVSGGEGPVLAVTRKAFGNLTAAGINAERISRVPFAAVDCGGIPARSGQETRNRLTAFDQNPGCLLRALSLIERKGVRIETDLVTWGSCRRSDSEVVLHVSPEPAQLHSLFSRAAFVWCGEGHEWRALACAAHGVPAVCARTPQAEEFVIHGETGLLCLPGSPDALAEAFERLITEPNFRDRLAMRAWERARMTNWDKTADVVLRVLFGS